MVPDFQTSMRIIRESNASFLSLLVALKSFLTEDTEVTITCNGSPVALPSLPAVIRAYQGGDFDSITLKNGPNTLTLSNDGGALKVSGSDGLANIEVAKVIASTIAGSTVTQLNATDCTIDSIQGPTAIDVSSISVQDLAVGTLQAMYLTLQGLNAGSLYADTLTAGAAHIGQTYISPGNVSHLFYVPGGSPYNYSAGNYVFADVAVSGTTYKFWKCLGLSGPAKDPRTYGFYAKPAGSAPISAPDAKYLEGDYSVDATPIDNVGVAALGAYGRNNITYTNVKFLNVPFYAAQSWPVAIFGEGPAAAGYGMAFLQEIAPNDEGKVFYFRTGGKPWRIARVLTTVYASATATEPSTASLSAYIEVPAYTCLRLRMSRSISVASNGLVTATNRLELV